jgi:hypothetical protein
MSPYDDPHVSAGEIADYLDRRRKLEAMGSLPEPDSHPYPLTHMKSPAEYLAAACQIPVDSLERARHLHAWIGTAEEAIATALTDAERYKTNIVGAVIRSHSSTSQPAEQATPTNES